MTVSDQEFIALPGSGKQSTMLQRLYVHNFRCLENFTLELKDMQSALLIGNNGVGKSTIQNVLEIAQKIGRGINRVRELVDEKDFTRARTEVPIRFELEVLIDNQTYIYSLALELPFDFKELRVFEEQLSVNSKPIYSRDKAQVTLNFSPQNREAKFLVDWHLVALPLIQEQSKTDPLRIFKSWLSRITILAPIPILMTGESRGDTLEPNKDASNFGAWFSGLLSRYPAAYTQIDKYLREVMPDIQEISNQNVGKDSKNMIVRFEEKRNGRELSLDFENLSDGEKCFFLCAVVLAANKYDGPLFCFWDEPDNYLSLSEVGHFVMSLRHSFQKGGQILVTSHNPEAILKFSEENTFFLDRKSHLEPTLIRLLSDLSIEGDLVNALTLGDISL